jgi:hypothetical protein
VKHEMRALSEVGPSETLKKGAFLGRLFSSSTSKLRGAKQSKRKPFARGVNFGILRISRKILNPIRFPHYEYGKRAPPLTELGGSQQPPHLEN